MDVATVLRRLNVTDSNTSARAFEYSRLLNAKLTSRHSIITPQSRNVVCVDIALEETRSSHRSVIDQSTMIKLSGASSAKHFAKMRAAVRGLIDVREHVSLQRLTAQYGCFQILHDAQSILTAYQAATAPSHHIVPPSQSALDIAVAFVLASVIHRVGVDRIAIRDRLGVAEKIWKHVTERMSAECAALISTIRERSKSAKSATRKRRKDDKESTAQTKRQRRDDSEDHADDDIDDDVATEDVASDEFDSDAVFGVNAVPILMSGDNDDDDDDDDVVFRPAFRRLSRPRASLSALID